MSAQALLSALTAPAPSGGGVASGDQGEAASAFSALLASETAASAEPAPTKRARSAVPAATPEPVEVAPEAPTTTDVPFAPIAPATVAVPVAHTHDGHPTDVATPGVAASPSRTALEQTGIVPDTAVGSAVQPDLTATPVANAALPAAAPPSPSAAAVEGVSSKAPSQAEDRSIVATTEAVVAPAASSATPTPSSNLAPAPAAVAVSSGRAQTSAPVATACGKRDAGSAQPQLTSSTPARDETGDTPPTSAASPKDVAASTTVATPPGSDAPVGARRSSTDATPTVQPLTAKAAITAWVSPPPRDTVTIPAALRAVKAASALVATDMAAEPLASSSTAEDKADVPVRSAPTIVTPAPTAGAAPAVQIDADLPTAQVTPSPRDIIEGAADEAGRTAPSVPNAATVAPTGAAPPSPSPTGPTQSVLADAAPQAAPPVAEAAASQPVDPLPAEATEPALPGSAITAPAEARAAAAPQVGLGSLSRATIETTAQLAAQITRRLEGRSTRFEMALTPDGLGRVDVSLDIDADGQLAARLAFDNPLAATDLRGRADELRRQLEDAGFTLARDALEFSQRDGSSGGQSAFDRHQNRATAYASRAAAEAVEAPIAAWINPSPTPRGVDLKV